MQAITVRLCYLALHGTLDVCGGRATYSSHYIGTQLPNGMTAPAHIDEGRPVLLIVDDDPLITDTLGYVLGRDFEVVTASSRSECVQQSAGISRGRRNWLWWTSACRPRPIARTRGSP